MMQICNGCRKRPGTPEFGLLNFVNLREFVRVMVGSRAMSGKVDNEKAKAAARAYQKPTLIRGPVLTSVTAIKAVSGVVPTCWIARAAFGEADLRWMIFREWLVIEAPAWFRELYIRRGEAVGAWLRRQPRLQGAVRAAMMPAVKRMLRK
jgi:hypothetical protein